MSTALPKTAQRRAGIYNDLPMAEYHADEALGHSDALTLLSDTPARFRWNRDHPQPEKREFDIGTAVHSLILEPAKFANRVSLLPPHLTDYRKKEAQEIRDAAYTMDVTPLLRHQYEDCVTMMHAVQQHPIAGELLEGGVAEESFFWGDKATGVMRKCRPDYQRNAGLVTVRDRPTVINLKTAVSVHPDTISRVAWDHHWHSSEAWTREGLAAHGVEVSDYLYVVVEKTTPHFVVVYRLPPRMVEMGAMFNRKAVAVFAECSESGVWPAYPDRVHEVEPPRWSEVQFEEARVRGDYSLPEIVG